MKKIIIAFLGIVLSFAAIAQISAVWKMSTIENKDKVTIGHIYHTYAIGTYYTPTEQKAQTGLRFVCSTTTSDSPVVAIYWKDYGSSVARNNQPMRIVVDEREIPTGPWSTDMSLLYIPLSEAREITDAMKVGKTIEFDWGNPGRKRTKFSLKDFDTDYYNFIRICNIKL